MKKGWRGEPARHSLAARGVSSRWPKTDSALRKRAAMAVAKSRSDGKEHGFGVDYNAAGNVEFIQDENSSGKYTIDLKDIEREASFHVHPVPGPPVPSVFDVVNARMNQETASVVANIDGEMICYQSLWGTEESMELDRLARVAWFSYVGTDENGVAGFLEPGAASMMAAQRMLEDDIKTDAGKIVKVMWRDKL